MEKLFDAFALIFKADPELRGIIAVTLKMAFASTAISALIGIPLGIYMGSRDFRAKKFFLRLTGTLMSLPPVVAGLVVFLLLSRSGPLGAFKLLYTVTAMVTAQVILITPLIAGMSASVVSARAPLIIETAKGLGIGLARQLWYVFYESKSSLLSVVLSGFGRAVAEVGAVSLVGGNIQNKTRVMTTAIMLETNMGRFEFALALGVVLLTIAFVVNSIAYRIGERTQRKRRLKGDKKVD
ncbi:MAG: ABC transporter permease [Oscillospiraceae bacterium]